MGGFVLRKKGAGREGGGQAAPPLQQSAGPDAPASAAVPVGSVRLTVNIGRELHTRLKLESVRRGETIAAMVSRWIEEKVPKG